MARLKSGSVRGVRVLWVASVVATTLALVGCAQAGAEPDDYDLQFQRELDEWERAARAENVDANQLAAIERIRQVGEVSYQEYEQAVISAVSCMEEAGMLVDGPKPGGSVRGLPELTYGAGMPGTTLDEQDMVTAIIDDCWVRHAAYVEALYQTQPSAMQWEDALHEQYRPVMIACLRARGSTISESAEWPEIEEENGRFDNGSADNPTCRQETGLSAEWSGNHE